MGGGCLSSFCSDLPIFVIHRTGPDLVHDDQAARVVATGQEAGGLFRVRRVGLGLTKKPARPSNRGATRTTVAASNHSP